MKKQTILFENKENIRMVAHRGLSGLEQENTCPAFVAAGVKSYYGIETDVHVTADGKFVLFHDDSLSRIAGVDGRVEECNFDELRALRLKDKDDITERADLFLPTVEEYISICRKYEKCAVLELKNRMSKEKIFEIVETIKDMGWYECTTFISFSAENLIDLRMEYPDSNAQFLTSKVNEAQFKLMVDNRLDADLNASCITKELVERLHNEGLLVNCWTVDTLEVAQHVKSCGVDFITTNILE